MHDVSQRLDAPLTPEVTETRLNKEYPNRPRNFGETLPFHTLIQDLFQPLLDAKPNKPAAAVVNRRRVGPDGQTNLSPSEKRKQIIQRYIGNWRQKVGPDFFPAFRLIIPDKDRERGVYGLKEKIIAKLLIKVMKIDRNSEDGYSLMNWKQPGQNTSKMAGDFAGRCHEALAKRPMRVQVGDMTIEEVNNLLDRMSAAPKEQDQLPILAEFYKRMNPAELMWLIRIILKEMRVGATERTFFKEWHEDAESLFNVSSSLRRVCWELYDPTIRLQGDKAGVALDQCFQPMLAAHFHQQQLKKIVERLRGPEGESGFWIEEKLDGERMQMHMFNDDSNPGGKRFRFWSRKAKDYTYLYGNGFEDPNGALTQSIKTCFAQGVENLILDGEMITWDPNEKALVPFGTLKTAALAEQRNPDAQGHRPVFRIFDILLLNNTPLTRYTLDDRRKALEASIKSAPERFEIHDYIVATKVDEVEDLLRKVIAEASEGLVLKNPRSPYVMDDRTGDWQKVKPEYMEGFGEELDCVIIGGYFGSGKRGGNLSSFLCGLRASRQEIKATKYSQSQRDSQLGSQSQNKRQRRQGQTQDRSQNSARLQRSRQNQVQSQSRSSSPDLDMPEAGPVESFISFFKVGGGMTANDYATIRHATDGKWNPWNTRRPSHRDYIDYGKPERDLKEKPDVWIKPSDSLVVQVKAAQVVPSEDYAFKSTLRFPRFVRLRRDRDWRNALSSDEFQDLKDQAYKQKELNVDQKRNEKRKARIGGYMSRKRPLTVAGYNIRDLNAVKLSEGPQGNVFEGLTFYIMTESSLPGDRKKTKIELEALVKANGGKIVQTATPPSEDAQDVMCVASRRTVKVVSLEKRGEKEIIHPAWIFDCIDQAKKDFALGHAEGLVVPFEPGRHLFFVRKTMKEMYEANVDVYGDSFARDMTENELKDIMDKMGTVDTSDGEDLRIPDLFGDDFLNMKGFLFHGMVFYFDKGTASPVKKIPAASPSTSSADKDAHTNTNGASPTTASTEAPTTLKSIAQFVGAKVLPDYYGVLSSVPTSIKSTITHIIAHPRSDLQSLRKEVSRWESRPIPRIVTQEWIMVCWSEGTRVDEEAHTAR